MPDKEFRLLLVGDTNVGKTCLLLRFYNDEFASSHKETKSPNFKVREIIDTSSTSSGKQKKYRVQIWDVAGAARFGSITQSFYKGSHGAILVYDVTNRISFKYIMDKLVDILSSADVGDIPILLIGNKSDLAQMRQVTAEEGRAFALENGIEFMETSAKVSLMTTTSNVEKAFNTMFERILANRKAGGANPVKPKHQTIFKSIKNSVAPSYKVEDPWKKLTGISDNGNFRNYSSTVPNSNAAVVCTSDCVTIETSVHKVVIVPPGKKLILGTESSKDILQNRFLVEPGGHIEARVSGPHFTHNRFVVRRGGKITMQAVGEGNQFFFEEGASIAPNIASSSGKQQIIRIPSQVFDHCLFPLPNPSTGFNFKHTTPEQYEKQQQQATKLAEHEVPPPPLSTPYNKAPNAPSLPYSVSKAAVEAHAAIGPDPTNSPSFSRQRVPSTGSRLGDATEVEISKRAPSDAPIDPSNVMAIARPPRLTLTTRRAGWVTKKPRMGGWGSSTHRWLVLDSAEGSVRYFVNQQRRRDSLDAGNHNKDAAGTINTDLKGVVKLNAGMVAAAVAGEKNPKELEVILSDPAYTDEKQRELLRFTPEPPSNWVELYMEEKQFLSREHAQNKSATEWVQDLTNAIKSQP